MPDDAFRAPAGDSSTAPDPNMGPESQDRNDNWQPIGGLAGGIVADVLRRIQERGGFRG
jgi:hypothetical protein